jgi:hypothetical protein
MGYKWDRMVDAALDAKGREWRNGILAAVAVRKAAPFIGVSLLLGGLGYLAHWAWVRATAVLTGATMPQTVGAMPGWLWLTLGAIVAAMFWLFRPGRLVIRPQARIVQASVLLILFAGVLGFGLSTITV